MLQEADLINEVDVEIGIYRKIFLNQYNRSKLTDWVTAALVKLMSLPKIFLKFSKTFRAANFNDASGSMFLKSQSK